MTPISEVFKAHKYPKWISSNSIFTKLKNIRKVYPALGLPNFEEKAILNNRKEVDAYVDSLLTLVNSNLLTRYNTLINFAKRAKIGKDRREKLSLINSIIKDLLSQLNQHKKAFSISTASGTISLNIPQNIIYKNEIYLKQGAGLFKLYNKIDSLLKESQFVGLPILDTTWQFKNFSSVNIPGRDTILKFSADGTEGAWDIATMSMRGVKSCQTWDQGVGINSLKLIGSIVDPFTGIIYLTTNDTSSGSQYGSTMIRRCVVHYVIDNTNHEPYLLLERMYPSHDQMALDTFTQVLSKRVPNLPIHYATNIGGIYGYGKLNTSFIPLSDEVKLLEAKYYPYCDSQLPILHDPKCRLAKNIDTLHTDFIKKGTLLFKQAISSSSFTKKNISNFGLQAVQLMSTLRQKTIAAKNKHVGKIASINAKKTHGGPTRQLQELSERFAKFICSEANDSDPAKKLIEQQTLCKDFLSKEFGNTISVEFSEYLSSNLNTYIAKKL